MNSASFNINTMIIFNNQASIMIDAIYLENQKVN